MKHINSTSWYDIYITNDAHEAATILTNKITEALNIYAPIKTVQVRKNYAPWLNSEIKALMFDRDEAQRKASASKDQDDWRLYKNLRNTVTDRLRKCKAEWEANKLINIDTHPKDVWKNIKSLMNMKISGPPTQLIHNGNIINSPIDLATTMNDYFIDKIDNLEKNLPQPNGDPHVYLKNIMKDRSCEFNFKPVQPQTVKDVVLNLKNSGSTGLDEINTTIIKMIIDNILPALTQVINLSLTTHSFPENWKLAKIIPLFKKNDPLQPKNYRPVALLPVLSKILERVVFKQITEYLDVNKLLHPSHHGSRAGHSTTTAIIEMYDSWINGMEQNEMSAVMMLDLSAAFDLVNHNLLLEKLKLMGFSNEVIKWFESYLENRSQVVYVDGKLSGVKKVKIGVPQGTVLGALLYILFTNDIPEVVHGYCTDCIEDNTYTDQTTKKRQSGQSEQANYVLYCKECGNTTCFVDDSTFTYTNSCPIKISDQLTTQYQRLAQYMTNNRLVINHDKTQLVIMGTRRQDSLREQISLNTGSGIIYPTPNAKLLGINIHQSMKWGNHVLTNKQSLINMLTIRLNGLKRISRSATFKTRLKVANACFMSILSYMISVWGGTEEFILNSVQVMQNKAAKCILKSFELYTPTRTILKQCGWLSVRQLSFYHSVLQIWKAQNSQTPEHIHSKLITTNTRSSSVGNLKIPATETALASKSFLIRSISCWNTTPPEIRECRTLQTLKKKLKDYIARNIPIV